ncbi:MAG: hypothetical protein LC624_06580 [Halobacteriales archaeon]|nr:hypothetical protein [Halobacteriales archaeon]
MKRARPRKGQRDARMADRPRTPWQLPAGIVAVLLLLLLLVPLVNHLADAVASVSTPPESSDAPPPPPIILPTETTITGAPESVHKGQVFRIEGKVVAQGTDRGVGHAPIRVWLNVTKDAPGVLLAEGESDADGSFGIEVQVNLSASSYQLVAESRGVPIDAVRAYGPSWSDPEVDVVADTRLTLEAPERGGMLAPVPVGGNLTDELGDPVAGASIVVARGDEPLANLTTGADGTFEGSITFPAPGTYALTATFAGDGHNLPSQAQASISIVDAGLALPASLDVVRGEALVLNGSVRLDGAAWPGANVSITYALPTLVGEGAEAVMVPQQVRQVAADASGAFEDRVVVAKEAPLGRAVVQVRLGERDVAQDVPLTVFQRPQVAVVVPAVANTSAVATVLVLDDAGQPLPGADVTLLAGEQGKLLGSWSLSTDAQGRASAVVNLSHAGDVLVGARVTGPQLAPTLAAANLHFAGPPLNPLVPIALVALVGVGAVAWFLRPKPLGPAVLARIVFPDLEPDMPPAWQPGEELALEVRCARPDGAPLAGLPVELRLGDETVALVTDAEGGARVRRAFAAEADLRLHARTERVEGLRRGEAEAELRIGDYRKEAGRAYDALVLRARARGAKVGRAPSPRDLQRALEPLLPGRDLAPFIHAFEAATYSLRPFDRAAAVRFLQAERKLSLALDAPAPRPPPPGGEPAVAA